MQRCVESTSPEYVVLELDKHRYKEIMKQFATTGDKYGISKSRTRRLLTVCTSLCTFLCVCMSMT